MNSTLKRSIFYSYFIRPLCSSLTPAVSGAALTPSIATEPTQSNDVASLESDGYAAIAAENWTWLLSIAKEGIALDAGNPVFYAMEGYAERKLGDYPAALSAATRSIEIQPNAVRYASRGITYLAVGNYTAALSDGLASAALDPGFGDAHALLSMAYLGLNRTAEAQDAIDHALAISPDSPSYWHFQGRIALAAGNCTLAVSSLERSVSLNPNYSLPWPTTTNATVDLAAAEKQCSADQAGDGQTAGKAPIETIVVVLAAAGAVFLAGRKK